MGLLVSERVEHCKRRQISLQVHAMIPQIQECGAGVWLGPGRTQQNPLRRGKISNRQNVTPAHLLLSLGLCVCQDTGHSTWSTLGLVLSYRFLSWQVQSPGVRDRFCGAVCGVSYWNSPWDFLGRNWARWGFLFECRTQAEAPDLRGACAYAPLAPFKARQGWKMLAAGECMAQQCESKQHITHLPSSCGVFCDHLRNSIETLSMMRVHY